MEPFEYEDLRSLGCSLPTDIESRKLAGDFAGEARLIDLWLLRDISQELRAKLHVEREILRILPLDYPHSKEEAFQLVKEVIPSLNEERFRNLQDTGRIDWIYVNGQEHFISSVTGTIRNDMEKALRREAGIARGSEFEENSPLQDSMRRMQENGSDTYSFGIRFTLRILEEAFHPGHVKVYLPVVLACDYVSDIRVLRASSVPYYLAPENAPIRTICFEEDMKENHDFFVEFSFRSRSLYHDLWSEEARALSQNTPLPAPGPDTYQKEDLLELAPHIVFTPFLKNIGEAITKGLGSPLEKARAIYEYITSKVTYSYVRSYFAIENLSEYALMNLRGDCGLQALSFIVLCRICGIPAKWQSGNECCNGSVSCHDWAMFYIAPWGWLYCDPSYGGSAYRCGAPIRQKHFFGNLDPFRVPSCSAFQVQLDPPMRYFRSDPYDNQSGEVEYEDGSLPESAFTIQKDLIFQKHL